MTVGLVGSTSSDASWSGASSSGAFADGVPDAIALGAVLASRQMRREYAANIGYLGGGVRSRVYQHSSLIRRHTKHRCWALGCTNFRLVYCEFYLYRTLLDLTLRATTVVLLRADELPFLPPHSRSYKS